MKNETYELTRNDIKTLQKGKEVQILTKDDRCIILKQCQCSDCKE